ncbi:uncharacterized protein iftap isoform 4-T5 [Salvelinus alpinus]
MDCLALSNYMPKDSFPNIPCSTQIRAKLDNYLDVGDFSEEEGDVTADPDGGVRVLPGEVEEELPTYLPSFCHLTQLDLTSTGRRTGTRPGTRGQQQDTLPQGQAGGSWFPAGR